jgi:hypothetical protein
VPHFPAAPSTENLNIHRHQSHYDASRVPTRIREEPEFDRMLIETRDAFLGEGELASEEAVDV